LWPMLYFSHKQSILSQFYTVALIWFPQKPYTLAGFELLVCCSLGGCDVHCATPPDQIFLTLHLSCQHWLYQMDHWSFVPGYVCGLVRTQFCTWPKFFDLT
jgi:hypothetical protein